jgi:uncharacterized membrane protein YeiH
VTLLKLLDLLGVSVSAISGALAAGRKRLDLIGVVVIAVVTAIGGGTMRDVLLDRHPIFWLSDPWYLLVILATAAATILWARRSPPPRGALEIADAFGLALFSISGAQIAERNGLPAIAIVVCGTITGCAGGVVRDVLTNEIPLVLRVGNLYASAAIVGVSAYLLAQLAGLPRGGASLCGMAVVVGLRLAAIAWGLRLPVFDLPDDS